MLKPTYISPADQTNLVYGVVGHRHEGRRSKHREKIKEGEDFVSGENVGFKRAKRGWKPGVEEIDEDLRSDRATALDRTKRPFMT